MRILFVRHGDPDYANDTLTEKGHREAALLARCIPDYNVGECYVSPLGRAQHTAAYSLEALGCKAETLDWLEEFTARIDLNKVESLRCAFPNTRRAADGTYLLRNVWDVAPAYWTEHAEYFDREGWRNSEIAKNSDLVEKYDEVIEAFDAFLAKKGYVRERLHYRVEKESEETVTFFCHFAITAVILSHLWNVSPYVMWHSLVLAPTSVSEIVTEEREQGTAYFRALRLGDISHLYAGKEPAAFAARFCEVYSNKDQRH